jgi:hypothetical protein
MAGLNGLEKSVGKTVKWMAIAFIEKFQKRIAMKKVVSFVLFLGCLIFARVGAQPIYVPARTTAPKTEILENQLPETRVQAVFGTMLLAIENADYPRFEEVITLNFRAHMDKENFKQLYGSLGTRMERGYRVIFMGELNKPGFKTFVYKLVFKDAQGEVLTTISFNSDKAGKISDDPNLKAAGFYVH